MLLDVYATARNWGLISFALHDDGKITGRVKVLLRLIMSKAHIGQPDDTEVCIELTNEQINLIDASIETVGLDHEILSID